MDVSSSSIFPLAVDVTREQQRNLSRVLWRWKFCTDCEAGKDCRTVRCPWQQASNLEAFFSYYRETTASYVPDLHSGSIPALRTHEDLLAIIGTLKQCAHVKRDAITQAHFTQRAAAQGEVSLPSLTDQNRAFSLAARVVAMINSSAENQTDGLLESGTLPITWQDEKSFAEFLEAAFPENGDVAERDDPRESFLPSKDGKWAKLTAKRLKKNAGLELVPTNNLQNHLRLDLKYKTVEIYHYTGVLKEHLLSSLDCDPHQDVAAGVSE